MRTAAYFFIVTLLLLCIWFFTDRYAQCKVLRRLFRNKGKPNKAFVQATRVLRDIDYGSAWPRGNLDIYTANNITQPQPVLLWVHGGGYIGGNKGCIKAWAHRLAAQLHIAVVSVDYALAPEYRYPVPLLQIGEALLFLEQNSQRWGLDMGRIFLAGDSAGAQIASQYAALVCNRTLQEQTAIVPPISREQLRSLLLCCGFYDMETAEKVKFPAMRLFLRAYTGCKHIRGFARKDEMSTVKHIDEAFCDTFLICGSADPFFSQTEKMARALRAQRVNCTTFICAKGGHEFQFRIGRPTADAALYKATEFIKYGIGRQKGKREYGKMNK